MATRPKASSDTFTIKEGATATGNLLDNDRNAAGELKSDLFLRFFNGKSVAAKQAGEVTEVTGQYGVFHVKADGTFDYVMSDDARAKLQAGETAQEVITYKISDGAGVTSQASLTVNVTGKSGPVAVNDSYTFTEGQEIIGDILGNDHEAANGKLILTSIANKSFGNAQTVEVEGTYGTFHFDKDGTFTYDLTADIADGQTVTEAVRYYKVSDGAGNTDAALVSLSITGTADGPAPRSEPFSLAAYEPDTIHQTGALEHPAL